MLSFCSCVVYNAKVIQLMFGFKHQKEKQTYIIISTAKYKYPKKRNDVLKTLVTLKIV